jgi:dienelactone hydrolase
MRTRRVGGVLASLVLMAAVGCSGPSAENAAAPAPPPPEATVAPPPDVTITYPVGLRVLHLQRGRGRPLPTLVFYPAVPAVGETAAVGLRTTKHGRRTHYELGWPQSPPARGRFPLVLFSHGLSGSADRYADALAAWAAAGFVVAAPTFPYTSEFTDDFWRPDIVNQPADARFVLARVQRLNYTVGDPLRHRIDTDHMAAIGHSAGGYTTTGLFTAGHDPRLRAGIVMAGWAARGAFAGPPATMLFLQGKADPIVRVASSQALYSRVPWPKSYVLMRRDSHATYLKPGDIGYDFMNALVVDFLRWTLEGDEAAHRRLPPTEYPPLGLRPGLTLAIPD